MKKRFVGLIPIGLLSSVCLVAFSIAVLWQLPLLRHRQARARWNRSKPEHYIFRASYQAGAADITVPEHWELVIEIHNGEIIGLWSADSGVPTQLGSQRSYLALDQMLLRIDERLSEQWRVVQLEIRNNLVFSPAMPFAQSLAQEWPWLDGWVPGSRRIEFIDPDCERFELHDISYDPYYGFPVRADFTFHYISFESMNDYSATRRCRNTSRIQIEITEFEVLP